MMWASNWKLNYWKNYGRWSFKSMSLPRASIPIRDLSPAMTQPRHDISTRGDILCICPIILWQHVMKRWGLCISKTIFVVDFFPINTRISTVKDDLQWMSIPWIKTAIFQLRNWSPAYIQIKKLTPNITKHLIIIDITNQNPGTPSKPTAAPFHQQMSKGVDANCSSNQMVINSLDSNTLYYQNHT